MSPPAGYTAQQLIFDDQFSGTSLDTTKWNTYLGARGSPGTTTAASPCRTRGRTPPRTTSRRCIGPSQVSVNDGLTLTAQRNTNAYAGTYPWISGAITTEGKFSLPTTGWYVQAKIKVPDMSQGMWPGLWFLPAAPGPLRRDRLRPGRLHRGGRPGEPGSPSARPTSPSGQSNPVGVTIPTSASTRRLGTTSMGSSGHPASASKASSTATSSGRSRTQRSPVASWPSPTRSSSTCRWLPPPTPLGTPSRQPLRPAAAMEVGRGAGVLHS